MALPRNEQPSQPAYRDYVAGGPVAHLHQNMEVKLTTGFRLPEWTAYADASAPTDEAVRHLSQAAGIVALMAGAAAVFAYIF